MHILVNGTTVTEWGIQPPQGDGVPFEVDDGGFLANVKRGEIPHWDGSTWWVEPDVSSPEEIEAAICELYETQEQALADTDAALCELYELIIGE